VEDCALLVKVAVALSAPVVRGLKVTVNGTLCPAGIVTGSDSWLMLKTELFVLAAVTVTLAPLALRLPVAAPLVPITTLPRGKLAGVTVSTPAVTVPVPDNGIVRVGFDALDVIVTAPLTLPAVCGANVTVKFTACPAVNVTGVLIPLRLKPVPLIPAWEIVTLEPPVLVIIPERVGWLPTVTLPKARLFGFDTKEPAETPVPDNGIVSVGFDALDVIVTAPLTLPADAGANVTVKFALCPDVSVTGVLLPLRLKPVPLMPACEIVTLEPPVLVIDPERVGLLPTVTLPNASLVVLVLSWPWDVVVPVPDSVRVVTVFEASLVMVTVAFKSPAALGAN